ISAMPLPVKSPTWTSTQVTSVLQVPQRVVLKEEPVETPTHQLPVLWSRAATSLSPSPLKSPVSTSTQVVDEDQVAHNDELKDDPVVPPVQICPLSFARPEMATPISDTRMMLLADAMLPPTSAIWTST